MDLNLDGLGKPFTKLIEVCASGMGRIIEPKQIRKIADAKAYEIKVMSDALLESQKKLGCDTIYENGNVKFVVNKPKVDELEVEVIETQTEVLEEDTSSSEIGMFNNDIERRVHYKNLKKEKNINNTLNFTMNELEDTEDAEVSDEQVDEDWITRFFNTVEDVNNEKLQALWGKILAGEIRQPNTYSLRTLELLRNLSIKEAELFSKVANFVIQDEQKSKTFLLSEKSILSKFDISFQDLLKLQDLDLLHPNELSIKSIPKNNIKRDFYFLSKTLIFIELPKNGNYNLSIYLLTSIGVELLNLVEREINTEYIKELSLQVKKQNQGIKVFSNSSPDEDGNYLITNNIEI